MKQKIVQSNIIGSNIKEIRIKRKLTQQQVSSKMQTLGCNITRGTYAKIEAGIRNISIDELYAIKDILKCNFDEMLEK